MKLVDKESANLIPNSPNPFYSNIDLNPLTHGFSYIIEQQYDVVQDLSKAFDSGDLAVP